jgi:hypothetical protein
MHGKGTKGFTTSEERKSMRPAETDFGSPTRAATLCCGWLGLRTLLRRLAQAAAMLCVTAVLLWYGLVMLLVSRAD